MAIELSAVLNQKNRMVEWASKVTYDFANLNTEDKEISKAMDAWVRTLGKNGDPSQEIAQLIRKAVTIDVVETPSSLIERMFDIDSIGEFDDVASVVDPKNTVKVYEGGRGGNVDRSFIDHKIIRPTWVSLIAETDVSLKDLRRGGYKTVAKLISDITEALEYKKIAKIINIADTAVTTGTAGCILETDTTPSATSAELLSTYLMDVTNGETPIIFGINKHIRAISKLAGAASFASDATKDFYNKTGFVTDYAGCELVGFSGQKKLPDGTLAVPDKRVFGIGGKMGVCTTRGTSNVFQSTDINSEKIHIKVSGFEFGIQITDVSKFGKIVLESNG